MYKAKRSVIIEDLFGIDHQFLKGHDYCINVDDTETQIEIRGMGYVSYMKKAGYFLSRQSVEENFEYFDGIYARGGKGSPKIVGWSKRDE